MQAATRMADGQWPWRDFGWSYGPGQPLVVMVLGKLFDPSLLWWRLLRVAADATCAVLVYALVRPQGGARWALAAWAAVAVTVAQPTSANPTGPALAFALAALLFATRARPGWAGAMAALAAFWRPDVGAIAALAAAATLLLARDEEEPEVAAEGGGETNGRVKLAARPAGGRDTAGDDAGGSEDGRWRRGRHSASGRGARTLGALPPRAACSPRRVCCSCSTRRSSPRPARSRCGTGSSCRPRATGSGGGCRSPTGSGAGTPRTSSSWLAPYAALLILVLAVPRFRRTVGLVILGAGAAVYFISRADLEHAQGLLVIAAAAAALVRPRLAGGVFLALLILVGTANRASALLDPPDLAPYGSVRVPPREAHALSRMVAVVQRLVPPGEPIYVAPLRSDLVSFSNPLIHYLTDRPNVLRRDVLLQAKPEEQERIVAALERARPKAIVRWTAPESATPEPNRRGRPSGSRALDEYLASAYVVEATFGDYEVLRPR